MGMRAKNWVAALALSAMSASAFFADAAQAGFIFKFDDIDQGEPYSVGDIVDGGQGTGSRQGFDLENGSTGNIIIGQDLLDINPLIEVTKTKDNEELVAGTLSLVSSGTGIVVKAGTGTLAFAGMTDSNTGIFTASFDVTSLGFAVSNIEVVPLPAAAWMMIGGLGVVGGIVRRRRRAAAAAA